MSAVYRRGSPSDFAGTKRLLYGDLITRFESELTEKDSLGLVIMDGDGSDTAYRTTHRRLPLSHRRVIEDAIHVDSRTSQLVQMADLVAWCANVTVDRHENNQFAWDWYATYLSERDPLREPQRLSPE